MSTTQKSGEPERGFFSNVTGNRSRAQSDVVEHSGGISVASSTEPTSPTWKQTTATSPSGTTTSKQNTESSRSPSSSSTAPSSPHGFQLNFQALGETLESQAAAIGAAIKGLTRTDEPSNVAEEHADEEKPRQGYASESS